MRTTLVNIADKRCEQDKHSHQANGGLIMFGGATHKSPKVTREQHQKLAYYLSRGFSQMHSMELAGLQTNSWSKISRHCRHKETMEFLAKYQAEREQQADEEYQKKIDEQKQKEERQWTKADYLDFLLQKMTDTELREQDRARYTEMYGKAIGVFKEKIEVTDGDSLADILDSRAGEDEDIPVVPISL